MEHSCIHDSPLSAGRQLQTLCTAKNMYSMHMKERSANKTTNQTWNVIVVGGGASGMMAAGRAAELGASVLVLEKNSRLGEKLLITRSEERRVGKECRL